MASILALLDSLQHRTTPPSAPCDYSSLRRAVVLVGHDDLVGLPVDYHSAPAFVNSPVRIAPCTAASYSTARQGDRPVRFFAAEELGIMACASVIQVAPPPSTVMLVLLLVTFVCGPFPTRPMKSQNWSMRSSSALARDNEQEKSMPSKRIDLRVHSLQWRLLQICHLQWLAKTHRRPFPMS